MPHGPDSVPEGYREIFKIGMYFPNSLINSSLYYESKIEKLEKMMSRQGIPQLSGIDRPVAATGRHHTRAYRCLNIYKKHGRPVRRVGAGGGIDGWFDLASFVATSSSNKGPYEELIDAIGKDCYIDIAGWHLFLKDIKVEGQTSLATVLGTKLGEDMMSRGSCDGRDIEDALKKVPIKLGQGKMTVALKDVMPSFCVSDLMDLCEEFARQNM